MGPCFRRDDVLRVLFGLLALIAESSQAQSRRRPIPTSGSPLAAKSSTAADGAMTGVRHAWTFDDMFTTYALQGIEAKTKGTYTRDEAGAAGADQCRVAEGVQLLHLRQGRRQEAKFDRADRLLPRIQGQHADAAFRAAAERAGGVEADSRWKCSIPPYFIDFKFEDKDPDQAGRRAGVLPDAVPAA
jgi:hypothetical protein